MKKIVSVFVLCMMGTSAFALAPVGSARRTMSDQMMAAPRAVAPKAQISAGAVLATQSAAINQATIKDVNGTAADLAVKPEEMKPADKVDMREKERAACLNNNIGIGNTFVWASRYSNLNDYSTMVEDVEEPQNNTCFVRVELKSNDAKVSVADVAGKYYEMGKNITCGEWANYDVLKGRILDAKKSARTWATVGGAVGGAAVGVGAMELFGNKLIGGSVQGQKSMSGDELLRSQLAVLKKDNKAEYDKFIRHLLNLKTECENEIWDGRTDEEKDTLCDEYDGVFDLVASK